MSKQSIDEADNQFCEMLASLNPAGSVVSRDEIMFEAGRQSALRELSKQPVTSVRNRRLTSHMWSMVTIASWLVTFGVLVVKFDASKTSKSFSTSTEKSRLNGTDEVQSQVHVEALHAAVSIADKPVANAEVVTASTSISELLPETSNLTPAIFRNWQRDRQTTSFETTSRRRMRSQVSYAELSNELLDTKFSEHVWSDSL